MQEHNAPEPQKDDLTIPPLKVPEVGLDLGEGNPSRSKAVNSMIGVVKVHKVRRTGSKSQATCTFNMEEFIKLLQVLEAVLRNKFKCAHFRALMTL